MGEFARSPHEAQTKKGHAAFGKSPLSKQMWYYLNEKRGEKELYLCQILENVSQIEKEQRDFSLKFLLLPASYFKILAFIQRISSHQIPTLCPKRQAFCAGDNKYYRMTTNIRSNLNVLGLRQAAGNPICVSSNLRSNSEEHHFSLSKMMTLWFRAVRSLVQDHVAKM